MARQANVTSETNFRNGLITEATGLNFPEAAVTETYDCEFDLDGSVSRRLGFDYEIGHELVEINRNNIVVNTYLWKNVAGNGDLSLLVKQVGNRIYFYELSEDNSFSSGFLADNVVLTGAVAPATEVEVLEAQYCDGNGYLIVTHPLCDPIRVSYDPSTQTFTDTPITIQIRDFEGVDDGLAVEDRPTSTLAALDDEHEYNLRNQGWTTANLTAWDTAQTTMPSNRDVMWRFKDSSDDFDASSTSIARVDTSSGNTPAPKGHFILDLSDQDRDAAAGTTGVPSSGTGSQRPSTSAFFAGRVFYAGINTNKYNSNIYFTQIIESDDQYGKAYQVNDPTSEELFDLLPSDGGVLSIPEAGTIYKLFTVPGGLSVHAENGVWFITGSTGIGFTANDYTVQKIAEIPTLTHTSFVNVAGFPCWWNSEGIYLMVGQGNLPQIQSLTESKIKTFFRDIPLNSKRFARGIFHYTDAHIRWIYRSTETSSLTEQYEFDRVLNFNITTGAFYPWTISESDIKVNAIVVSELHSGNIVIDNVMAGADNVVDDVGNQVIAYSSTGASTIPFDKYLVSYPEGGSYKFTFASKINASFLDWAQFDGSGIDYNSYFITGYKLRNQGIRKFQSNYIRIFSRMSTPISYYFQGIWDFASTGSGTGRWSTNQLVEHDNLNYSTLSKRLKVRGHGLALQFKVESVPQKFFDIIGWSSFDTGNTNP